MAEHDTLVLRIFERNALNEEIADTYVFYDYKKELFGICGNSTNKTGNTTFSFYCADSSALLSFIEEIHKDFLKISFCLVNYVDMPVESEDINYDYLSDNYSESNEITGFNYSKYEFNLKKIEKYLKILCNVYNEW